MHSDPELLGLLALGERAGTAADHRHVQNCPECAGELSQLHRVATLARSVDAEPGLIAPSHDVWARIRDELEFDLTLEPSADHTTFLLTDRYQTPDDVSAVHATPAAEDAVRPARPANFAAMQAALVGSSRRAEDGLTAHARLRPVEAAWSDAFGTADLATDEHGRRLLQVALQAELPTSGVRQAWLVHRDDPTRRQTLGILDGPLGLWTVEHSIDLAEYPILEISQQGTGETDHSGQTIVRGELTLAS